LVRYLEIEDKIQRYYPSRLRTYLQCGEKYRRRYIEGERISKSNIPFAIGSAIHECAEEDNKKKIETEDAGLPKDDIIEIAVQSFQETAENHDLGATDAEVGKGKDSCASGAGTYADEVSPITKPVCAEEHIVAQVLGPDGNTYELAGILDVAEEGAVGDLKTGTKSWNQANADAADQLTLYGILFRSRFGKYPERMWIANLVNKAKGWKFQHLETTRTIEQYMKLMNKISLIQKGIDAGTFLPAAEGDWGCSQKWCEYWTSCPYAQGR
jgi:hypothetical protein